MFYSCFLNNVLVMCIMTIFNGNGTNLPCHIQQLILFPDDLDYLIVCPESFMEGKHLLILYFLEGVNFSF